jgi:hypothetical protein
MGRPSWESSLLGVPSAKFFYGKWAASKNALGSGPPAVELALRCALSAPPSGLRRASLRASSTTPQKQNLKKGHFNRGKKGDILKEV